MPFRFTLALFLASAAATEIGCVNRRPTPTGLEMQPSVICIGDVRNGEERNCEASIVDHSIGGHDVLSIIGDENCATFLIDKPSKPKAKPTTRAVHISVAPMAEPLGDKRVVAYITSGDRIAGSFEVHYRVVPILSSPDSIHLERAAGGAECTLEAASAVRDVIATSKRGLLKVTQQADGKRKIDLNIRLAEAGYDEEKLLDYVVVTYTVVSSGLNETVSIPVLLEGPLGHD